MTEARLPQYFSAYMTKASPAANSNDAGLGKTWSVPQPYTFWQSIDVIYSGSRSGNGHPGGPPAQALSSTQKVRDGIFTGVHGLMDYHTDIVQFNFTIPKNTPNGQYLLRGEQIALHVASSTNGAQFYIGCAQINVVGGGSGSPSPTVSFPGAYSATDPGILINIYSLPSGYSGYQAPGPAVWSG
ncbi:hypothetical protein H0H87_007368 [Tephrocybe sp. NHM501043]|nr:hypothetical protein H0H87_007368 [Tephrocybe sp. NHM501043]